jgi:leucyl/phenylalanyl-tRNA--protein transferase
MPVFQLSSNILFPSPELAEPDGLLALGGDLSPERLLAAYRQGIFPWYSESEPILWWSPSPRLVLLPELFHLPKRLARTIRQQRFQITTDTAFDKTITACGVLREQSGQGTWITPAMREAYISLHELGFAHSVECWQDGKLAGGLYGVQLDQMFFGESMFSCIRDASKVALATLVQNAESLDIRAIDCQMTTNHLLGFGAQEMSRQEFQDILDQFIQSISSVQTWTID